MSSHHNVRPTFDLNKRPGEGKSLDRPEWLPEDWEFIPKIRPGGKCTGRIDKYYLKPSAGVKFRSETKVMQYLGIETKQKKRKFTPEVEDGSSGSTQTESGNKCEAQELP